jgi:large subunit ribosomal protein L13
MINMIIDAKDLILGRLASFAAKQALLGETVDIVNAEEAVITGNKRWIIAHYVQARDRGIPLQGPYFKTMPDRFVKRTVRGMLPYKQGRGKDAYKRVMCYIGVPISLKDKKTETIDSANLSKLPNTKFIKVGVLCKLLGAKI